MYKKWITIEGPKGQFLLNLDNVTYAESNGAEQVNIFLVDGKFILFNGSLDEFETLAKES